MDELWQGRDPRFYASVWTCGSSWENAEETGAFPGGGKIDMHDGIILPDGSLMEGSSVNTYNDVPSWGQQTLNSRGRPGFGIMKYLDPNANNMKWLVQSTTDYQVFRYAEILLSYAEAQFELGETGEALNAVNQIRKRAGILQLTSIDREKICHERKVELAFENHRYWDLRRWRIAREKLSREYSGIQYILDYNTRKFKIVVKDNIEGGSCFFPESNYYFPITRRRTDQNPNLLPENPGY
jgi:hypothetical protein